MTPWAYHPLPLGKLNNINSHNVSCQMDSAMGMTKRYSLILTPEQENQPYKKNVTLPYLDNFFNKHL